MTIPAIPGLQQPTTVTRRPVTAQNAQFGMAPPSMAGDRSATHIGGRRAVSGLRAAACAMVRSCDRALGKGAAGAASYQRVTAAEERSGK
jgi:hypothetical protein